MIMYPFASLRRRMRPCRRCGGSLVVGDKVYHWWCERCVVRKFSDHYRLTYLYAFRRFRKALRNLGLEFWRAARGSTIVEVLSSDIRVERSNGFPYKCFLCGHQMTSADDRLEWHGLGNCVDICDACCGTSLDESQPDPEAANLPCPKCEGRGWFPMPPLEDRPALRFPDRPIVPARDAHFGED